MNNLRFYVLTNTKISKLTNYKKGYGICGSSNSTTSLTCVLLLVTGTKVRNNQSAISQNLERERIQDECVCVRERERERERAEHKQQFIKFIKLMWIHIECSYTLLIHTITLLKFFTSIRESDSDVRSTDAALSHLT